jgi:hypothetical protein
MIAFPWMISLELTPDMLMQFVGLMAGRASGTC